MSKAQPITVYLPDTRGVEISRYGYGNLKLGLGVFTYSRIAGNPEIKRPGLLGGTCPGSTAECEAICYAKRIEGPVQKVYGRNGYSDVPPIPLEAKILRIHVSGDFDSVLYIEEWIARLMERPDVIAWAYTRSWRIQSLLPALERLRALPNLQLFASMDASSGDVPPAGWRRAWIWRDKPNGAWPVETRLEPMNDDNQYAFDGTPSYVCPEETQKKPNCLACGYCFEGQKNDVTFLEH